jgi:hypothetical protein
MIGHKASNKKYFKSIYPDLKISYRQDASLSKGEYQVLEEKEIKK